ncbi:MAG: PqqD family protein [Tannerella sp.]|jgi:hypothetical protein|nr:PqqD family protein [Tannerella sp.]
MKIKEELVLRRIGCENIIIVPEKDSVNLTEVYTLNDTSAWIWEQFKNEDFTVELVANRVQQYYEVDLERAMNDVKAFIDILIKGGLILVD